MTKERKAMSVDVKEAVYSTTEGHDELPFRSDNPVYSDTWGVATVDPDSKQAFWAQVLHNGSSGRSEERRVGKECVSTGSARWWTNHKEKKIERVYRQDN